MSQFLSVFATRCSHGHVVWDVVWRDNTRERLHQGRWPNHLNLRSRNDLVGAQDDLFRREA